MAQMANRGKRSIALNLQSDEGRAILIDLARDADVFAQNFRPGVVERLGVGYEDIRAVNPEIIYLSISGFGASGPYASKSAYDPVVQAYAGLASAQAGSDAQPQLIRHTAADKITSLTASQAVTAALYARDARAAGGQHLEVSMLESVVQFVWADAAGNEVLLDADGSQPSSFSRDQKLWKTKDGWIIAAPTGDKDVEGICKGVGVDGWDDDKVRTMLARRANPEAFKELLRRVLAKVETLSSAEALAGMEREGAPCGAVLAPADLPDDPQVQALGMLEDSEHPAAGPMRQPRPAPRFGTTPAQTGGPAPTLGQQTDEILAEIGRGDQVAALREAGVVA